MDISVKSEDEEYVDSSSDSVKTDEWQDLSKSDYAKVIFCDLYHQAYSGGVGCKFQITDNVHEDPCDFVGLFRVGYDNLSQCLVSKMLSETECEEDGKLLRCVFSSEELPDLEDGFYQFLYVTRDKEVCGASMPFEIKQAQSKEDSSDDDVVTERAEDDFLLVRHGLEKKNLMLEALLEKYRTKNLSLSSDMEVLLDAKDKICQEKENIISNLHQEILALKSESSRKQSTIVDQDSQIRRAAVCVENFALAEVKYQEENKKLSELTESLREEVKKLLKENLRLKNIIKEKDEAFSLVEPEQRILIGQLDDQKFMIRALEDSKQLAMKEMSDLSESLTKRTKVLNQTRCELGSAKGKLTDTIALVEKQKDDIQLLSDEIKDLMGILGDKEDLLTMQAARIGVLEDDANQWIKSQKKAAIFTKTETMLPAPVIVREVQLQGNNTSVKSRNELLDTTFIKVREVNKILDELIDATDFQDKYQEEKFYDIKITLLVMLSKMRKPKKFSECHGDTSNEVQGPEVNERKTIPRVLPSFLNTSTSSSEINTGSLESILSEQHQDPDIDDMIDRNISDTQRDLCPPSTSIYMPTKKKQETELLNSKYMDDGSTVPLATLNGSPHEPRKVELDFIPDIIAERSLQEADVAFINKLTDKMTKREPNFLLEFDLSYNMDSDFTECVERPSIKSQMNQLENIINALIEQPCSNQNLSKEKKLVLEEWKKQCQIEILLLHINSLKKEFDMQHNKLTKLQKMPISSQDPSLFFAQINKLQLIVTAREATISKLKEEISKKEAVIEFLSAEKLNLLKNEAALQETVTERAARITEAGELYKNQFIEIKKLKKKLKHVQRLSSKLSSSKTAGYASSSTAEDVPPTKTLEKAPPPKRPRKTTFYKIAEIPVPFNFKGFAKGAEKTFSSKPPKRALKSSEKGSSSKAAQEAVSSTSSSSLITLLNAVPEARSVEVIEPFWATSIIDMLPPPMLPKMSQPDKTVECHSVRSTSDSDTGERVLGNTTAPPSEGDSVLEETVTSGEKQTLSVENPDQIEIPTVDALPDEMTDINLPSTSSANEASKIVFEPPNRDLKTVQRLFTNKISTVICIMNSASPTKSRDEELYTIPCSLCNEEFTVTSLSTIALMDHLEIEHEISMCPICGQLFEASFPKKYLEYHVEEHFKSE